MTLLIAFAGILVTIYTKLPLVSKLNIKLLIGFRGYLIIILGFLLYNYMHFYSYFKAIRLTPSFEGIIWYITTQQASYLVIIGFSTLLYIHFKAAKLAKRKIFKFCEITEELLRLGDYKELIILFEKHLNRFDKILRADFLLSGIKRKYSKASSLRIYIESIKSNDFIKENNSVDFNKPPKISFSWIEPLKHKISDLLPGYEKEKFCANELFRTVLLSNDFIKALIKFRPYFALKIFDLQVSKKYDFFEKYLYEMISDNETVFYNEIRNNQNTLNSYTYEVPESNKLLFYLFDDPNVADNLCAWKPIGKYLMNELDNLRRVPEEDTYNYAMDDFYEEGKWKSSLFIGIFFFDIMVSRAIYKCIIDNIGLYYYTKITDRIVRNYNPIEPLIVYDSEWPTKYHFLLYEIIANLNNWIKSISEFPGVDEEPFESLNKFREKFNIQKDSIIAIGQCVRYIIQSNKFTTDFEKYIIDIAFDLYFRLNNNEYSKAVFQTILTGGNSYIVRDDTDYLSKISLYYNQFDKIPFGMRDNFEERNEYAKANLSQE